MSELKDALTAQAKEDIDTAIANVRSCIALEAGALSVSGADLAKCLGGRTATIKAGLVRQRRSKLEADLLANYKKGGEK